MEQLLLLVAWMVAGGSPGPATLAIAGTAMQRGRAAGLAVSAGIVTGSAIWGVAAAAGMSALMVTHVWLFTAMRYAGAAFLIYLAYKALRAAWRNADVPDPTSLGATSLTRLWGKGALIHLTNPKAILGWGGFFAVAVPADASSLLIWETFAMLIAGSCVVFFGYGFLFSSPGVTRAYRRARRWFETVFGVLFGTAGLTLFFAKGSTP